MRGMLVFGGKYQTAGSRVVEVSSLVNAAEIAAEATTKHPCACWVNVGSWCVHGHHNTKHAYLKAEHLLDQMLTANSVAGVVQRRKLLNLAEKKLKEMDFRPIWEGATEIAEQNCRLLATAALGQAVLESGLFEILERFIRK